MFLHNTLFSVAGMLLTLGCGSGTRHPGGDNRGIGGRIGSPTPSAGTSWTQTDSGGSAGAETFVTSTMANAGVSTTIGSGGAPTIEGAAGAGGEQGTAGATFVGYHWANVKLGGGGFVSAVIASLAQKDLFYARTDVGGFYRWNEAEQSWIPLVDWAGVDQTGFLGVEAVALDAQSPGRVYALVGIDYFNGGKTAILRSTDYGESFALSDVTSQFKAHGNGMGRQNGERLAVDPNLGSVLFCGTRRNGLFKSSDYGANWTRVASLDVTTTPNDNGISFVLFDKSSAGQNQATARIFLGVSRMNDTNFYVSKDGGTTWTGVDGAPTNLMPGRAALAQDGILYVTYGNGAGPNGQIALGEPMDTGAIWKYDIAQNTWKDVTPAGITRAFSGISIDSSDPWRIIATTINTYLPQPWGNGDRIFLSADGGESWTDLIDAGKVAMDTNGFPWIVNHAIHWAGTVLFDPNNSERVFVTSGNGIFSTNNLSADTSTWKFSVNGLEETVPLEAVSIEGGSFVTAIGDYDGAVHADVTVSPESGTHKPGMGTTTGLAYAGSSSRIMARLGSRIFRTDDAGSSWTQVPRPTTARRGSVALSADGTVLVWTPDQSTTSYRTADLGVQWAAIAGINFVTMVVGDPVNANRFYAYDSTTGAFFVSSDAGVSFTQASTPGTGTSLKIRTVPGIEGDIWVAHNAGGLTRSTDSGTTFTKIANVPQCSAVGFGRAAGDKIYPTVYIWGRVGTGVQGIYRSEDTGTTWQRINDDKHQFGGPGNGQVILGDMNVYGRVYMSTAGRGIVYGEPN